MRWAILSDIHGNLEAFEEVLKDLKKHHIDRIICLGDIVGYGANPNECVTLSSETFHEVVVGNHDYGAIGELSLSYFNLEARIALQWTEERLNNKNLEYLASLPVIGETEEFTYVHATPFRPLDWNYIFFGEEAILNFGAFKTPLCFIGHSHAPLVLIRDREGRLAVSRDSEIILDPEQKYLINVGSIGQPRDGNPQAAYGIYDSDRKSYSLVRVSYDIEGAQAKIIEAGLPHTLAMRLSYGQ